MKKAVLFGALALAAASTTANAALIIYESLIPAGTGGNDSSFDEITCTIGGWTGADATTPNNGVTELVGTFTASDGGVLSVPARSTHPFTAYIVNANSSIGGGLDAVGSTPASYVNFDSEIAASRSPSSNTPNSLTATWYTPFGPSNPPDTRLAPTQLPNNPGPGTGVNGTNWDSTLLAQIFVTPGDNVSFTGTYSSLAGFNQPLSFWGLRSRTNLAWPAGRGFRRPANSPPQR